MQTKEQILKNLMTCTCSERYKYRRKADPDCAYCSNLDTILEAMELYASQRQGMDSTAALTEIELELGTVNLSSHTQMKVAIETSLELTQTELIRLRESEASPTSQPAQGEEQLARKKGVHTFGALIKNAMKDNLVSTVPDISTETLNDLLNDNYYPNSVPIKTLRNMLRLLNIPIENAVPAIYHTFELLQLQKEESRKEKRFYEINWKEDLWKCDEALDKYINRLIELMSVSTHPSPEPVAAKELPKLKDFPHLVKMEAEMKKVNPGTKEYWELRAINREKMDDPTYSDFERSNCAHFHRILVNNQR
jgi:hypothetical protein